MFEYETRRQKMRLQTAISRAASFFFRLALAVGALCVASVSYARSDGLPRVCSWVNSASNQGMQYGDIDLDASYYAVLIQPGSEAGVDLRIDGQYPAARYFSFMAYKGAGPVLSALTDYEIAPVPGSQTPFTGIANIDTAIAPGVYYSVRVQFGPKPAQPAPNTLYIDPAQLGGHSSLLIYRIYNPLAGIANPQTGGFALPSLTLETPQGDVPISPDAPTTYCRYWASEIENLGPVFVKVMSALSPVNFLPSSFPRFNLYRDNFSLPLQVLNIDNNYMGATISSTHGDLILVRGRAPTFATDPGLQPQMRHWSVCENNAVGITYGCVQDRDAAVDGDGFFNIVISTPDKMPATATHAYGFDWLTYGPNAASKVGVVIYRQQLPAPDFAQAMRRVGAQQTPQSVMGDYAPQITYCSSSVFADNTSKGASPASVFAACAAAHHVLFNHSRS
jgi:hypothetical protein